MPLQVYLFRWPRIERGNQPVRINRSKSMALIAYLAINAQPIGREVLAALFYPESDSALVYLRRDLSELRKILGQDALSTNGGVDLVTNDSLWVDVVAFREALELVASHNHFPGRPCTECPVALESAVNLYADDFLAGFNLTDCPQFDEWQFFQAESLRQSLDQPLQNLIRWYESQGQWGPAIERGRRWLSLDPLNEPAQRKLMELYANSGQWTAALRQYELSVRQLEAELGVAPEEETVALYEAIRSRRIDKRVEIEWLAQHPVTRVLKEAGETIHPMSALLASESAHWERSSNGHGLHCFYTWRDMDEILLANFMVFLDVVRDTHYDVWIGDESWEVDYYLHENPELKTAPYVFMTDFFGWVPIDRSPGSREAFLTADYNAEMIEQVERFKHIRDRAIYIGKYEDLLPARFGPGLPHIPEWTCEHFVAVGDYIVAFNPADHADKMAVRERLGYRAEQLLLFVTVGGRPLVKACSRKRVQLGL